MNIAAGDSNVCVGYQAGQNLGFNGNNSGNVLVGYGTVATSNYNTVVGYEASAEGESNTVLGASALAEGDYATALGWGAQATGSGSVAIGVDDDGNAATAPDANQIVIGTSNHTVTVPGELGFGAGYGINGTAPASVALTDASGVLSSDYDITTSVGTFMTTASLGIGTWVVNANMRSTSVPERPNMQRFS